jgi:hypothetical protein
MDKKVDIQIKFNSRISLHKGLREKKAEAWKKLSLTLEKLKNYEDVVIVNKAV